MFHLSPDAFVDLLDGTIAEAQMPHLATCERCREQLSQLRATWQTAVHAEMHADVPEPSPLFWDHLAARIRESVSEEVAQPRPAAVFERGLFGHLRAPRLSWWSIGGLVSAVGAVALAVAMQIPRTTEPVVRESVASQSPAPQIVATTEPANTVEQDETLGFVTDLASGVDWDAAVGFEPSPGEVDRSVASLNEGERVELQRLLTDAIGGGA
jgi:hypothetical protein